MKLITDLPGELESQGSEWKLELSREGDTLTIHVLHIIDSTTLSGYRSHNVAQKGWEIDLAQIPE